MRLDDVRFLVAFDRWATSRILAVLDEADEALWSTPNAIGEPGGPPMWQLLAHVVNHATQHRSEAAALLTAAGRSPGDLDMVEFAEDLAAAASDA